MRWFQVSRGNARISSGAFGEVPEPHALCFELMTCLLGLACVPFVLFKLPGLGVLVLRMRPTAYDQAGNLRLQLSRQRIKKKFDAKMLTKQAERAADRAAAAVFGQPPGLPPPVRAGAGGV